MIRHDLGEWTADLSQGREYMDPMEDWAEVADLTPHPLSESIYRDDATPELIDSIQRFGVMELIVTNSTNLIISGHRRWKACKTLGIDKVRVWVDPRFDDKTEAEAGIIEFNRKRDKTREQMGREYAEAKRIAQVYAKRRRNAGIKSAKTPRSDHTNNCSEQVNLDTPGESRQVAAEHVGVSFRVGEQLAKAVQEIDKAEHEGNTSKAEKLRQTLENGRSVSAAVEKVISPPKKKKAAKKSKLGSGKVTNRPVKPDSNWKTHAKGFMETLDQIYLRIDTIQDTIGGNKIANEAKLLIGDARALMAKVYKGK